MNSEMKLNEINKLLKAGDVAAAESAALELLKKEPGNLQAKMLYGTCLQLQGDRESFGRIHEELVPKMTVVSDEKTLSISGAIRIPSRVSATSRRSSRANARSVPSAKSVRRAAARWRSRRPVPSPKPRSA